MRQAIKITGRNWHMILPLPCVTRISKYDDGGKTVYQVHMVDGLGLMCFAYVGDSLVEKDDGSWYIRRGDTAHGDLF